MVVTEVEHVKAVEKPSGSHEHLVTEHGFHAAHLAVLTFPLPGSSVQYVFKDSAFATDDILSKVRKLVCPLHPCHCQSASSPTTSHGTSVILGHGPLLGWARWAPRAR